MWYARAILVKAGEDMDYHRKPIIKLIPSIDYIHFVCGKCEEEACEVDYLGLDPSIPLLKFKCPKCGDLGTWKLEGAGQGFYNKTKK